MDGGATFYLAMTMMAAGTAVMTVDQINANKARQRVLEQELRNQELAALDQENERLIALREANDQLLANSGNIDPYGSPSLLAARRFNFEMVEDDVTNIRHNLASSRAETSAQISILKANSRARLIAGILDTTGVGLQVYEGFMALQKPGGADPSSLLKTGTKGKKLKGSGKRNV